jgi:hypothetical protein
MTTTIPVRRRGGTRDLADRIESQMPENFPLFAEGDRLIMFLRETRWYPPAPHVGIYYYGTTYDGPDSFFHLKGGAVATEGRSQLARSLAAMTPDALRAHLDAARLHLR